MFRPSKDLDKLTNACSESAFLLARNGKPDPERKV